MMQVKGASAATISATIKRADGTIEELGVIAYWHQNPLRRWVYRIKKGLATWLPW